MRRSTEKLTCESSPIEGTLFVQPNVADKKDAEKDKHGDKGESSHVLGNPTTI
jgi:hypothetical protein